MADPLTLRVRARLLVSFGLVGLAAAQQPEWRSLANGHRCRTVAIDGASGVAVAVAFPWPAAVDADVACGLAAAEAARRAAVADATLPREVRTQVEVGHGQTSFCVVLDGPAKTALGSWLTALVRPLDGVAADERADLLQRDLAIAALAADDSDWLYPGDRLAGAARRATLAGSPFGSGLRGDAKALLRTTAASFAERLAASPSGPLFVAAVGHGDGLAAVEGALARLPAPLRADPVPLAVPSVAPIDCEGLPPIEPHPRVDAGFAAIALLPVALEAGGFAEVVAVEVLRRRARQKFADYRGAEVLARAPYVQADALLGDPLVVLHRRAPTPDFLDPSVTTRPASSFVEVPHRELVELLRDCERTPVRPAEVEAALAVVRAEWAVPPYAEALQGAMRRLPQAMLSPARTLCQLGRRGLDDTRVRDGLAVDAMGVSAALQALARRAIWHGGLVPVPPKPIGG